MTRAYTEKTPLYVLRYRYYWWFFILFSPAYYYVSVNFLYPGPEPSLMDAVLRWFWMPMSHFIALTLVLGYLYLMFPISRILVNLGGTCPTYEWWLRAGGHPYWDCNTWCNFDRAVVRAAIGRPPEGDYCVNCGYDLRGMFNTGGNFGNCCNNCGMYNDSFDHLDIIAFAFGSEIGAPNCGPPGIGP